MTDIELNRRYTPTDPEWRDVVAALREGDEVEVWTTSTDSGYDYGRRGPVDFGNGCPAVGGLFPSRQWESLTVTPLAPREPSWAGARVVMDRDGDVWVLRRGHDYQLCNGGRQTASIVESEFGPITVLLDADGRIPVESVLKINGVTRDDLCAAYLAASLCAPVSRVEAVLDALGGAR